MRTTRTALAAVSVAAALIGLNACGSSTTTAPPVDAPNSSAAAPTSSSATSSSTPTSSAAGATGTLEAASQSSDGQSVMVDSVNLDAAGKGGWIALHADADGKPGPVKYFVAVPAGASSEVAIPTPDGISSGDYWPMLHVDDSVVGTYEFPQVAKADLPAMDNGMVVMKKITVTVK